MVTRRSRTAAFSFCVNGEGLVTHPTNVVQHDPKNEMVCVPGLKIITDPPLLSEKGSVVQSGGTSTNSGSFIE